jgi:hypothetical protein
VGPLVWNVNRKRENLLFRGVTGFYYADEPSIFRNEYLSLNENVLYSEFYHTFSLELDGLSRFNVLAMMQHHGLPTRLLDASQNPLVALYMACTNQFDVIPLKRWRSNCLLLNFF